MMSALADEAVFVGLGSNMDNPAAQVSSAIDQLANESGIELKCRSSLYDSAPWGELEQADFVNAVVQIATSLEPAMLLDVLQAIENRMGRRREGSRWGPRVIDLDLLAFGERVIKTERLHLPHPRIAERAFVLVPFAQIAAEFCLPDQGPINQLLTLRDDAGTIRCLNRGDRDV